MRLNLNLSAKLVLYVGLLELVLEEHLQADTDKTDGDVSGWGLGGVDEDGTQGIVEMDNILFTLSATMYLLFFSLAK